MGDLEVDTRLEPRPAAPGWDAGYRAGLSRDWEIWGPNGGYLAAIALRAAGSVARIPRPAALAGHFLSVARFAAVDVDVAALRRGRRSEALRVRIAQEGRLVFEALLRTAAPGPGLDHDVARAPDVPDPDGLASAEELAPGVGPRHAFWRNFDERPLRPERFQPQRRPGPPVWREWYRLRPRATFDDPFLDAGRLALLVDTLTWPAAARAHPQSGFTAPNLDLAVWFHRLEPESEWLLADHESPVAAAGLVAANGRVWSRGGRLLASGGAQLLCVPAPPAA